MTSLQAIKSSPTGYQPAPLPALATSRSPSAAWPGCSSTKSAPMRPEPKSARRGPADSAAHQRHG
jgi:hypothetical protein